MQPKSIETQQTGGRVRVPAWQHVRTGADRRRTQRGKHSEQWQRGRGQIDVDEGPHDDRVRG